MKEKVFFLRTSATISKFCLCAGGGKWMVEGRYGLYFYCTQGCNELRCSLYPGQQQLLYAANRTLALCKRLLDSMLTQS